MAKKEKVTARGITAQLRLLILEDDLNKIKKLKNPERSKVFKQYSNLLLNVLKNIEVPKINSEKINKFNSVEDLEKFNG